MIFGTNAGSSRVREFSRGNEIRHKNFQIFLGALEQAGLFPLKRQKTGENDIN
jgi:hypothetical protein